MIFIPFRLFGYGENARKRIIQYFIFISAWLSYVYLLSTSGFLNNFDLPPRMPLMIVIPVIIFMILITRRSYFKKLIEEIPDSFLTGIQSFRILVELLIYGAFLNGIFPERATFAGLNFDILVGVSAPIIAFLCAKSIIRKRGILLWNFISLSILTVTVYSFISSYFFLGFADDANSGELVSFPYILLPSVLLPFAIFYHILSIRKHLHKT